MNAAARLLNQGSLSRSWVMSVFLTRSQVSLFAMLLMVLISAISVVYVTNSTRSLNANLQQAIDEKDRFHLQKEELLLEKGTWLMQARIQKTAEDRLKMVVPESKSVVVINE